MREGWPAYQPFRAAFAALCPERYPVEHIDAMVRNSTWRCWGTDRAAILAEIRTYPSGLREVHGLAAAGNAAEIVTLIPLAEDWGRSNGCTAAAIESRPGWDRILPDYRPHQLRIVKDL